MKKITASELLRGMRGPSQSPCTGQCHLRDDNRTCSGCGRTLQEVKEWWDASDERRAEIERAAAARRRML